METLAPPIDKSIYDNQDCRMETLKRTSKRLGQSVLNYVVKYRAQKSQVLQLLKGGNVI